MVPNGTYYGVRIFVLFQPSSSQEESMARKATDVVQFSLRLREALRLRLEGAAKKRAVTINYEITDRLQRSLDVESLRGLDQVAEDMRIIWARYAEVFLRLDVQRDLIHSVETLIARIEPVIRSVNEPDRRALEGAIAGVQTVIDVVRKSGAV
jgi:hypothetical protein